MVGILQMPGQEGFFCSGVFVFWLCLMSCIVFSLAICFRSHLSQATQAQCEGQRREVFALGVETRKLKKLLKSH